MINSLRAATKYGLYTSLLGPPVVAGTWYLGIASPDQKNCTQDIVSNIPTILQGGAGRFLRSLQCGLLVSFDYKYSLWGLDDQSDEYSSTQKEVHTRSAQRVLQACLANGGLYIKFGQGMVTSPVLPKEFADVLSILQDQALIRKDPGEIENIFIEDLGSTPSVLFKEFNPEPIAAASLAQVFKAVTYSGETVAVKVQYKDLRERFSSDVATMESVLDTIQIIHPKFAFKWVFKELRDTLENELDFVKEAKNSIRCSQELNNLSFLYVPKVVSDLTSKRVLTSEFIDGIKISDVEEISKLGINITNLDYKLLRIFSEQLFHTGFIHADPHPGNILVRRSGGDGEIVLLDHGLYEEIAKSTSEALSGLWVAVVEEDHRSMQKFAKQLEVDDYRIFAMALCQRYITPLKEELSTDILAQMMDKKGPKAFNRKQFNALPEEQKAELRKAIMSFHDRMFDTLQQMPAKMVLVLRNLNTIRSIIKDHKTGVDRFRSMARVAVSGKFGGGFKGNLARFGFEMRLVWDMLKMAVIKMGIMIATNLRLIDNFAIEQSL